MKEKTGSEMTETNFYPATGGGGQVRKRKMKDSADGAAWFFPWLPDIKFCKSSRSGGIRREDIKQDTMSGAHSKGRGGSSLRAKIQKYTMTDTSMETNTLTQRDSGSSTSSSSGSKDNTDFKIGTYTKEAEAQPVKGALTIGKMSFSDFSKTTWAFNLPNEAQNISTQQKIIIDNLWVAFCKKDRAHLIITLNALAISLAKAQKIIPHYVVYNGPSPGIYTKWGTIAKFRESFPKLTWKKLESLPEAVQESTTYIGKVFNTEPEIREAVMNILQKQKGQAQPEENKLEIQKQMIALKKELTQAEEEKIMLLERIDKLEKQIEHHDQDISYAGVVANQPITIEDKTTNMAKIIQENTHAQAFDWDRLQDIITDSESKIMRMVDQRCYHTYNEARKDAESIMEGINQLDSSPSEGWISWIRQIVAQQISEDGRPQIQAATDNKKSWAEISQEFSNEEAQLNQNTQTSDGSESETEQE